MAEATVAAVAPGLAAIAAVVTVAVPGKPMPSVKAAPAFGVPWTSIDGSQVFIAHRVPVPTEPSVTRRFQRRRGAGRGEEIRPFFAQSRL
jgi:hypothetical protein